MQNLPNPANLTRSEILRPGEAARLVGVTPRTLSAMKELHPLTLPSGHRRYLRSEIEALAAPTPTEVKR